MKRKRIFFLRIGNKSFPEPKNLHLHLQWRELPLQSGQRRPTAASASASASASVVIRSILDLSKKGILVSDDFCHSNLDLDCDCRVSEAHYSWLAVVSLFAKPSNLSAADNSDNSLEHS